MTLWDPDADGPQPHLAVFVGDFAVAGGAQAADIAAWDGQRWRPIGDGLPIVTGSPVVGVSNVAVYNNELYVAGYTTGPGFVARWTGSQWESLGMVLGSSSLSPDVSDLAVFGEELIVAGQFLSIGGVSMRHIARWNGTDWAPFGAGAASRTGELAVHDGQLVVSGSYSTIDGVAAPGLAAYDGVAWTPITDGPLRGHIAALGFHAGDLIVAGYFTNVGPVPMRRIARWDGAGWHPMGAGLGTPDFSLDERVLELHSSGDTLAACGRFHPAPDAPAADVARWNGSAWEPVGVGGVAGPSSSALCSAVIEYQGNLLIGGLFQNAGGVGAESAAAWDGNSWRPLGRGLARGTYDAPAVSALLSRGDDLVVAGSFTSADGLPARRIASWNGAEWSTFGAGLDGSPVPGPAQVHSLATFGDTLVAGGTFLTADGISVNHVAQWDGDAWAPLDTGVAFPPGPGGIDPPVVRSLAEHDGALLVGGAITSAGGVPSTGLARWTGSAWEAFAQPMTGSAAGVRAMAMLGPDLFVAGTFSTIGGVVAPGVARWDGSAWHPVGGGVFGTVHSAAAFGDDLFISGQFLVNGGVSARVARWDGAQWSTIEGNGTGSVYAVLPYNGTVVAAGTFLSIGGVPASNIARWDGVSWQPMGDGLNGSALTLATHRGELVVGGYFTTAGGEVSARLARWTDAATPWTASDPADAAVVVGGEASFTVRLADGYDVVGAEWRRDGELLHDGPTPHGSIISGATTASLTVLGALPPDGGQYEVTVQTPCGPLVRASTLTVTGPCPADWNADGLVNSTDISAYLAAWLTSIQTGTLTADFNHDSQVDSTDTSAFLTAWLQAVQTGC